MKTATLFAIPMLTLAGIALTGCDGQKETSTIVVSKAQERAMRMGVLANMPKDCAFVASVFDVPNIVFSFQSLDIVKELINSANSQRLDLIPIPGETEGQDVVEESAAVENQEIETYVKDAAIGFGPSVTNWAATEYLKFIEMDVETSISSLETLLKLMVCKDAEAVEFMDNRYPLGEFLSYGVKMLSQLDLTPAEGGTAPFLAVATLTPEGLNRVQQFLQKIQEKPSEFTKVSTVTYDGMSCVQVELDLPTLANQASVKIDEIATQGKYQERANKLKQLIQEKVQNGRFCVVFSLEENTLRLFASTNPELQVKRVNSLDDSILAKGDFDFADNYLEHKNYALAYCDKELAKSMIAGSKLHFDLMMTKGAELVKKVAPSWKLDNAEATAQAVSGIGSIYSAYYDEMLKSPQAQSLYVWQDNGINIEWEYQKDPASDLTSNTMANIRPTESTIFYSTSKFKQSANKDAYKVVGNGVKAVWDFFYTYATKHPSNSLPKEAKMALMGAPIAVPVISSCWQGLGDCVDAGSGATTVMLDMNGHPAPELQDTPGPRLIVAAELDNRAKLSEGWNKVYKSLTPLSLMTGSRVPEPKVELVSDVSLYDYELPMSSGLNPVVAVSDKRWALGMPREFVLEQLEASNLPKPEVNTMEMLINFTPLKQYLQNAAKQTQADNFMLMLQGVETIAKDLDSIRFTGKPASETTNVFRLQLRAAQK